MRRRPRSHRSAHSQERHLLGAYANGRWATSPRLAQPPYLAEAGARSTASPAGSKPRVEEPTAAPGEA